MRSLRSSRTYADIDPTGGATRPWGTSLRRYLPVRAHRASRFDPIGVRTQDDQRGQVAVEFALVFPIFILLIIGLIEFAFAFNALLSVNFASRDAALLAAESGANTGSDCVILNSIDADVQLPASRIRISQVRIYWADDQGAELAANVYSRTGDHGLHHAGSDDGLRALHPHERKLPGQRALLGAGWVPRGSGP